MQHKYMQHKHMPHKYGGNMSKKKKKSSLLYAVIGLGRFGSALARSLAEKGEEVLVIDRNRDKINAATDYTDNAYVVGDLTAENLEEAGVAEADVAIICIGDKLDVSLLATLNVLKLGVKRVISKAMSTEQGEILSMMGAEVVYPEHDMAIRLAGKLVSPHILEYIGLSDTIDIVEIALTEKIAGMTVIDLGVRKNYNLNIIAIRRGGEISIDIRPDTVFEAEDTVTVIGKYTDISRFEEYLHR